MQFAIKLGDKYGKRIIDTATKTRIDAAKTASKRVVQETPEATGDSIRNSWQNNFSSYIKKETEDQTKKIEEISYIIRKKTTNY